MLSRGVWRDTTGLLRASNTREPVRFIFTLAAPCSVGARAFTGFRGDVMRYAYMIGCLAGLVLICACDGSAATRRASTFPPATKVPSTSTATTSPTVT